MTSEQTKALINDLYATLAKGDREHLSQIFTEDVVWQMPSSVPDGILRGRERVVRELGTETVRRLFQRGTFRLTIHNIFADGNTAIVQTGTRAVTKEDKIYEMEYAWIYTCRDGQIAYIREYLDTKLSAEVLGWDKPQ